MLKTDESKNEYSLSRKQSKSKLSKVLTLQNQ